jgi:hypothetical protein
MSARSTTGTTSVASLIVEQVPVSGLVSDEVLPDDVGHRLVAELGDAQAPLPQDVLHGERVLRDFAFNRGHARTVVAAYALPQRSTGCFAHIRGCGHGLILTDLRRHCLGSTVVKASQNSTRSRSRLSQLPAGPRGNRTVEGLAAMTTLLAVANENSSDLDFSVLPCGECLEGQPIGVARWAITWTGGNIDGEPVERREVCCDQCLPLLFRYAIDCNQRHCGFTPVEASPLNLSAVAA